MESDLLYADDFHGDWEIQNEVVVSTEGIHPAIATTEESQLICERSEELNCHEEDNTIDVESHSDFEDLDKEMKTENIGQDSSVKNSAAISNEPNIFISPPYFPVNVKQEPVSHQVYFPSFTHGYSASSTYHQPFVSMVRQKKASALTAALQRQPASNVFPIQSPYSSGYPFEYRHQSFSQSDNGLNNQDQHPQFQECSKIISDDKKIGPTGMESGVSWTSTAFASAPCSEVAPISHLGKRFNQCFQFQAGGLEEIVDEDSLEINQVLIQDERQNHQDKAEPNCKYEEIPERSIRGHENKEKLLTDNKDIGTAEEESEDEDDAIVVVDDEKEVDAAPTTAVSDKDDLESATSSCDTKHQKSSLKKLLLQPVKKPAYPEYSQPFVIAYSAIGTSTPSSGPPPPKTMQFYQPPAQQHLARNTPPPGFIQPYGMGMRPHEEETRQIMNLDSQQTHNSSPTSSWNQPYGQMTNLNAYQQRGPNLYAPPVPPQMVHQNGPPGVVPTSNPYYPTPGPPPPHHHMQPQAPMMPPGMHGQQQQPYYNTQSPLTGSSPSMNYGNPQIPAPPPTANGSAPIFNFSKPRTSNEGPAVNGGGHRRKKHHDLSSPRYNNNGNEDVDGSIFPDMSDFPLLDVVQSKAKKDAGRKPCRPHLCEQSRMLISRVCHFHREFVKRLPSRHPLANSPFSKPDQWTSQIMGISLATVRKCIDMAVDEEVFTRCTDKNLVNLTPSERAEREELLSKLSTVFEDEKTLGAGTAGMTIAEYSPRRSYSNTLIRQSTDDKSSNSSFANGAEYGSSETTLLNLDDHSNHSKDFVPSSAADLSNGGQIFEEIGSIGCVGNGDMEEKSTSSMDTPKRGRPRKAPGMPVAKQSKRKESQEDRELSEDKEEQDKKTEDEDETNEESEKKSDELQEVVLTADREDDAASSEGTTRSETATPEPAADTSVAKKTRAAARRKNTKTLDEDLPSSAKKKRGSVTAATAGVVGLDDENSDHKMVTRARSRQP